MDALRRQEATEVGRAWAGDLRTLGGVTGAIWAVTVIDWALGRALAAHAIAPRTVAGLLGVPLAPLLHGGVGHLLVNTLALWPLGFLAMQRKRLDFWVVAAASTLTSGLGAWALGGTGTLHLGASGVIFGLLGFLLGRGWFEQTWTTVLLSSIVLWTFGGMLFGVLPFVGAGISWQSHLFGLLGGLAVAQRLAAERRRRGIGRR
jgi:membrane associated rhomboid family serine protease